MAIKGDGFSPEQVSDDNICCRSACGEGDLMTFQQCPVRKGLS
ncbi:hypothetical protein EDC15_101194 [Acetobacter aceti NBRC 14818]|nr:hypothetical protein EDC15_101194 [Acetobacter aceti NBRC 14818]